jgi:signal peptidase I
VPLILEMAFTVLVVMIVSLALKTFVIQSFFIPTQSMEDTLLVDDRIMVTKLSPAVLDVHRGDIVVFHDPGTWADSPDLGALPQGHGLGAWIHGAAQVLGFAPSSSDDYLVKRVIGLPGDAVACAGPGQPLTVNGVELEETYLKPGVAASDIAFDVVVPRDSVWLMGDNRSNSGDSRFHRQEPGDGAVAVERLVGVAQVRLWPFSRLSLLRNPHDVFRDVPAPAGQ